MRVLKKNPGLRGSPLHGFSQGLWEERHAAEEVIQAISQFQHDSEHDEPPIPVRLSPTTFVSKEYVEEGWEIAVVRYPLREDSDEDIVQWAGGLAAVLMKRFRQEQISAVIRNELMVFTPE